ncbi:MAG: DUF1572 family protein [Bacteriovoracaceae bacterium]
MFPEISVNGSITTWGEKEFHRERNIEFSERKHISPSELINHLRSAIADVDAVLEVYSVEKLFQQYHIQKYTVTGLEAILHITEHFSYHVGQIVYITKLRSGKDLHFYQF